MRGSQGAIDRGIEKRAEMEEYMNIIRRLRKGTELLRKNWLVLKTNFSLKTGRRVTIGKRTDILIEGNGLIELGNYSSVAQDSHIAAIGGHLTVGDHSYFNRRANVVCRGKITIGDNCAIGPNVTIYDHDHKFGTNGQESGFNTGEIHIGNNCWIGANVTILRGTYIGDNCVIGAGCIVKGEIPCNNLITQDRKLIITELR